MFDECQHRRVGRWFTVVASARSQPNYVTTDLLSSGCEAPPPERILIAPHPLWVITPPSRHQPSPISHPLSRRRIVTNTATGTRGPPVMGTIDVAASNLCNHITQPIATTLECYTTSTQRQPSIKDHNKNWRRTTVQQSERENRPPTWHTSQHSGRENSSGHNYEHRERLREHHDYLQQKTANVVSPRPQVLQQPTVAIADIG